MASIDNTGRYHETGTMILPHHRGAASRDYLYEMRENTLHIRFADGKPFLTLAFEQGRARDVHVCGDDVYAAEFILRGEKWIAVYRVQGPRKNYRSVSVMSRTGSLTCAD